MKKVIITLSVLVSMFISQQAFAWGLEKQSGYDVNIHTQGRVHQDVMGNTIINGPGGRTTIRTDVMGNTTINGPQGRATIRQDVMGDITVRGNLPGSISVTPMQQRGRFGKRW